MNRALTRLTVNSMPKYYAVAKGREGPKVYNSWDECKDNAQTWLSSSLSLQTAGPSQAAPHSTGSIRSRKPYSRPEPIVPTQAPAQSSSSSNTEAAISGANVVLSPEQQDVLRRVGQGQSIFFSGSAGTGKSVLLREIIRQLGGHGDPTVGITASTGIAAVNIGGTTLHSWAGIGIGNEPAKKMTGMFIGQHERFVKVLERWRTVRTLIIDEISMVDGALFDKLVRSLSSSASTSNLAAPRRRWRASFVEMRLLSVAFSSFYLG
ncbi:PIF1-like helicase-domain-containing protein [Mycena crocata]|nr:PIF1-like helicase-domain-containing protein [Mycena crocata]